MFPRGIDLIFLTMMHNDVIPLYTIVEENLLYYYY